LIIPPSFEFFLLFRSRICICTELFLCLLSDLNLLPQVLGSPARKKGCPPGNPEAARLLDFEDRL